MSYVGPEDMNWVEPEDDSAMQDAIFMALTTPCYICSARVPGNQGWHRDGRAWCPEHRPVWSFPAAPERTA